MKSRFWSSREYLKGLVCGLILGGLLIAYTGHAGVPSLYRPLVHMQRVMGMRVARHAPAEHWFQQVRFGYTHPPHRQAWLCIHRFEGSWADPNAPYYGGLQADLGFQHTYAGYLLRTKGTADHWSPLEQMWMAERAYRTRGFYPWPNTARYCGLIR